MAARENLARADDWRRERREAGSQTLRQSGLPIGVTFLLSQTLRQSGLPIGRAFPSLKVQTLRQTLRHWHRVERARGGLKAPAHSSLFPALTVKELFCALFLFVTFIL